MDPRIGDIEWDKEVPNFIDPPRLWRKSSFSKVKYKYIGISLKYILTPGEQDGDVYWTHADNLTVFLLDDTIDFIYKKNREGRYELFLSEDDKRIMCPDCKGSCEYIGFTARTPCQTCNGIGKI